LMIPAAMIGLASAIAVPAVMQMLGGGGGGGEEPPGVQMDNADLVSLLLGAYVKEAYPKWQADHPGTKCPASLDEVATYFGADPGVPVTIDPWGHALVMKCDDTGFTVMSVGPDGTPGTADDVTP